MTKLKRASLQTILGLLLAAVAYGQPTFTATTLSSAYTAGDTVINVASATGFTAKTTVAQIGRELMQVLTVSGTKIGVRPGAFGTRSTNHGNGMPVLVAANENFSACGGGGGGGPCGFAYNSEFSGGPFYSGTFPVTLTTAGALTYTAGQVLAGLILRDPNGAARTDTTPTAALLVAAVPGAMNGSSFRFTIRNDADAAETITVAAGTGGTTSGTMTIAQSNSKEFLVRFTRVDSGNEAYTIYSLGTVVH